MSIRTLTTIAAQRDEGKPRRPAAITAAEGSASAQEQAKLPSTLTDSLISAIPTEILGPYTAMIGIIVGLLVSRDDYLPLRWAVYGATAALVVAAVIVLYGQKKGGRGRTVPFAEVTAATVAFGVWGLVMPGSPLEGAINSGTTRAITDAVLAFGATVLLTLIGAPLTKASKSANDNPGSDTTDQNMAPVDEKPAVVNPSPEPGDDDRHEQAAAGTVLSSIGAEQSD
jgi:hypothetical protein